MHMDIKVTKQNIFLIKRRHKRNKHLMQDHNKDVNKSIESKDEFMHSCIMMTMLQTWCGDRYIIQISSKSAYVLYDLGATHFFISACFVKWSNEMSLISLETDLYVSIPSRDVILINLVCKDCVLGIEDRKIEADLLVLEMDFDLIL